MPTGHLNFRTAYGNVGTRTFRGARYGDALSPILRYPLEGRVLDLSTFTYTFSEVPDISGGSNEAALYSGRGVSLNGNADFIEIDALGTAVKSIKILAGAVFDDTLYVKDLGAGDTASVLIDGDSDWHEVELVFTNPVNGPFAIGTDMAGANFGGVLANVRFYDANGSLINQSYLNSYKTTSGLDTLPIVGRSGGVIGQYVGCAALVQEGMDQEVIGLGDYEDKMWFDAGTNSIALDAPIDLGTANFTLKASVLLYQQVTNSGLFSTGGSGRYFAISPDGLTMRYRYEGGSNRAINIAGGFPFGELVTLEIRRVGTNIYLDINGVTVGSEDFLNASAVFLISRIGDEFGVPKWHGLIYDVDIAGQLTWDGTIAEGDTIGTINGSPATVADKRRTPPQVLGMDFNEYQWFNGVDTYVSTFNNEVVPSSFQSLSGDITIEAEIVANDVIGTGLGAFTPKSTVVELRQLGGAVDQNTPFSFGLSDGKISLGATTDYVAAGQRVEGLTTLLVGKKYKIGVVVSGDNYEFFLDGASDGSGTFTTAAGDRSVGTALSSLSVGIRAKDSGLRDEAQFNGVIYNLSVGTSVGSILTYTGQGSTPWKDTIGSNDGTPSGAFTDTLIPSYSGTTDALGNPVNPRGSKTFNCDGSGYALIPDSDSLDLTTEATWVLRGNFYGDYSAQDGAILDKDVYRIWKNDSQTASQLTFAIAGAAYYITVPNSVADVVIRYVGSSLEMRAWVDGVSVNPVQIAGTLLSSIVVNTEPLTIGTDPTTKSLPYRGQIDLVKIYNRALTDEEIQNANWS